MPLDISLAQFNKIASGDYNAGQIDIKTNENGDTELVKVNHHVWKKSENKAQITTKHILEVKEAFIGALRKGGVHQEDLRTIRERLGIPEELTMNTSQEALETINKRRFTPLSRAEVRDILNQYANGGSGLTDESQAAVSYKERMAAIRTTNADKATVKRRNAANAGDPLNRVADRDFKITDAISLLSTTRSLSEFNAARDRRSTGPDAANERMLKKSDLVDSFSGLVNQALKLLHANVHESPEFRLCGETVKLVKDENGQLSAILGKEPATTKVKLGSDAQTFLLRLMVRATLDMETLEGSAIKNIMDKIYDKDLEGVLTAADRTSFTRHFAALVIAKRSGNVLSVDNIMKGNYNTGLLLEIANHSLEENGERPVTEQDLKKLHDKLVKDNAGLDEDMKKMLSRVANIPLQKPDHEDSEFLVQSPMVADIDDIVAAMPHEPQEVKPRDIGLDAVKDFVADLVFSDDTMVADVIVNKPGESMRNFLSTDERIIAFAEIIRTIGVLPPSPGLLAKIASSEITGALTEGFNKLIGVLDEAFKKTHDGASIREAAKQPDFVGKFSLFLKNAEKLPGSELAKFDSIIQSMANKGCESIQAHINKVFQINVANVNENGALINDPYKDKSAADIKKELDSKSLNQILDTAANADVPGQVGFFKQIISDYFVKLAMPDKRSCFAAAMRYAQNFDFGDKEGEELDSAKKAAVNKFTGAILKGTSPLLQKMMQGLPKDVVGKFADALEDMKANLAPIPRKVVQAHLMRIIDESNGKIKSIELEKSLGAASVGEAFLCRFKVRKSHKKIMKDNSAENIKNGGPKKIPELDEKGQPKFIDTWQDEELVVKIMRHDAEARVEREAKLFTAAAKKIPGMDKTWEGQLKQYMTEFDFTTEAQNINVGQKLYDMSNDKLNQNNPMRVIAPDLESMKISKLVPPKKDVLIADLVYGRTLDAFFKKETNEIRNAVSSVFERDPATKRIRWIDEPVIDPKTNEPVLDPVTKKVKTVKVPVVKADIPATAIANVKTWITSNYGSIQQAQDMIIQASKVWFHEALLGKGRFHGDAHSGNLMVSNGRITFIDFGNLYRLNKRDKYDKDGQLVMDPQTNQPVKIDERVELLRVMLGATVRDKKCFLQGFENLLSPAGKQALEAKRDKAEAILDSVLAKGQFSYDIAYRLQAAVIELQKLGLELPPQINCFIQSMVRLQNTVSEMNTILNQAKALLDATQRLTLPAKQRDDLDIIGKAFDIGCSAEGQKIIQKPNNIFIYQNAEKITAFQKYIVSDELGGVNVMHSGIYKENGAYYEKVAQRLKEAANPSAEADKLVATLCSHADPEHNENDRILLELVTKARDQFKQAIADADTPAKKTAAIKAFCDAYCRFVTQFISKMQSGERDIVTTKLDPPATFASAIMGVLFDNSDAVNTMMDANFTEEEKTAIRKDVTNIATSELNVNSGKLYASGFFGNLLNMDSIFGKEIKGADEIVMDAIIEDAKKMGGDKSYQVDIGV